MTKVRSKKFLDEKLDFFLSSPLLPQKRKFIDENTRDS